MAYFLATLFMLIQIQSSTLKKTHQFLFPRQHTFSHAKLVGTIDRSLVDFTLCYWSRINTNLQGYRAIFSYAEPEVDNSIAIFTAEGEIVRFYVHQEITNITKIDVIRHQWLHTCIAWSIVDGKWEIYINGESKNNGFGLALNKTVEPGGSVILGQDQDTFQGGFDSNQAFKGQIADLNLWDRLLTPNEISAVHNCIYTEEGNIISWNLATWKLFNGTQVSSINLPC